MPMPTWQATIQDLAGNAIPDAVVTVRVAADNTLADIFDIDENPISNPFQSGVNGFAQFKAAVGTYTIQASGESGFSAVWDAYLLDQDYLDEQIGRAEDAADDAMDILETLAGYNDALTEYRFTATAAQTVFTGTDVDGNVLRYRVGGSNVYRNGILMIRDVDYVETNDATITFNYPLEAGETVIVNPLSFGGAAGVVMTNQYVSVAAAQAVTVDPSVPSIEISGRTYFRSPTNPHTSEAFQDAGGAWFTPVSVRSNGPVEVWVGWGQSEMRGVSGAPAAVGGDRTAQSNVLVYVRGTTLSGVPDGWYPAGPADTSWPFASSILAVGSPFYKAAAARAAEIGGTVCVVMDAIGGAASGLFIQGGSRWNGLQASWSGGQAAPLPGRGGQTLANLGRTRADVMMIWQGVADRDAVLGTGNAAASADDWVLRWRTILNSLESPSGTSVPITSPRSKIVFFEMLHGGTSGGAPGVGDPTDSRNRDLHKLFLYTSGKRRQIRIVPMDGVNFFTIDPERIGSYDNLHLNGAAYNEVEMRLWNVLTAFDPNGPADAMVVSSAGFTICYPNGTFQSFSTDLTAASAVTATGSLFRSSYVPWNIPMPVGYAVASVPNFTPGGTSVFPSWVGLHVRAGVDPVNRVQTYALAPVSTASAITYRVTATGFWVRT
jgi:hypothetical protein